MVCCCCTALNRPDAPAADGSGAEMAESGSKGLGLMAAPCVTGPLLALAATRLPKREEDMGAGMVGETKLEAPSVEGKRGEEVELEDTLAACLALWMISSA